MTNKLKQTTCSLNKLNLNESGVILSVFHPIPSLLKRFVDMGLTKGTVVTITKISPLSNPIAISFRHYELCLRRQDLQNIIVEVNK